MKTYTCHFCFKQCQIGQDTPNHWTSCENCSVSYLVRDDLTPCLLVFRFAHINGKFYDLMINYDGKWADSFEVSESGELLNHTAAFTIPLPPEGSITPSNLAEKIKLYLLLS